MWHALLSSPLPLSLLCPFSCCVLCCFFFFRSRFVLASSVLLVQGWPFFVISIETFSPRLYVRRWLCIYHAYMVPCKANRKLFRGCFKSMMFWNRQKLLGPSHWKNHLALASAFECTRLMMLSANTRIFFKCEEAFTWMRLVTAHRVWRRVEQQQMKTFSHSTICALNISVLLLSQTFSRFLWLWLNGDFGSFYFGKSCVFWAMMSWHNRKRRRHDWCSAFPGNTGRKLGLHA